MRLKHLTLLAIFLLILSGCGNEKPSNGKQGEQQGSQNQTEEPVYSNEGLELLDSSKHPEVTIEMSNGGIIKIELYPEIAPNTVSNFVTLAQEGYYDGVIFHRVIPGFMIQGGDPLGTGGGGPGYTIKGEFSSNGFDNPIVHARGVISMARVDGLNDSAGSQFFIMQADSPHLDGDYAAFGEVTEGMEVVDEIAAQKTGQGNMPLDPLVMNKVTVDLRDSEVPELEKIVQ
ncbi:peptidyl-prolyl cis-trans isomerase [Paenibacillus montaniterrae]|uniref:Peptidyl-prolyl cis-trans isomerase n=1 Tax=Paenibacillus montaniterrae TaxID=429341 RepID=A0A919YT86_9BACL|nr:peptidylprolyl isomerase [Paenibacillus montaniterrae]GIP17986.1 peptidyl-prolyl cis-trans isomerase [Paenibacillus montaniterrae]